MQRHRKVVRPPRATVSTGAKQGVDDDAYREALRRLVLSEKEEPSSTPDHNGPQDGVYTPMPEDWVPPPRGPAMFTDVIGRVYAWQPAPPQPSDFEKLRYKYGNADLWDTLTEEIMDLMLNPPETYDPAYQRKVNLAVLTSIKTLENATNLHSKFARAGRDTLDKRTGKLERAVFGQTLG